MMEVYAAALSYCDTQMGRVLNTIEGMGELDNTLVIYTQGDNGASAEGTPQGLLNEMSIFNNIPEDFKQAEACARPMVKAVLRDRARGWQERDPGMWRRLPVTIRPS